MIWLYDGVIRYSLWAWQAAHAVAQETGTAPSCFTRAAVTATPPLPHYYGDSCDSELQAAQAPSGRACVKGLTEVPVPPEVSLESGTEYSPFMFS